MPVSQSQRVLKHFAEIGWLVGLVVALREAATVDYNGVDENRASPSIVR